nr:PAS domain S-box protein [Spirochaetales bacterium]
GLNYSESLLVELFGDIQERFEKYVGYAYSQHIAREEAENSRESLAQLDLLMNLWKAGRWTYMVKTHAHLVDENWKEIFGVLPGTREVDYHDYFESHIHEEDRAGLIQQMNAYMQGESDKYHAVFRFHTETKGTIWVEGIGVINSYNPDGSPKSVIGLNRDITEEMEQKLRLEQTGKLLRSLVDNMPSGVFWKDRNSLYLGCNDVFAHDAGVSSYKEVIGKTDRDLPNVAAEYEHYRKIDQQVLESGEPVLHEETVQHHMDGEDGWRYTSKVPLIDENGGIFGLLGVYSDITELKRTEQQLRERENRLQAIFNSSSDIIGMLNTDFSLDYLSPSAEKILGFLPSEHFTDRL